MNKEKYHFLKVLLQQYFLTFQNSKFPIFLKNNGFKAVVAISQNFLRNKNYSIKFKKRVYVLVLQI